MAPDTTRHPGLDGSTKRVWIDAQLPPALAVWLREGHGTEATHVHDLGLTTATDREIFEASSQPGAVVVTKDSDFVLLLQQRGPPPQVVWVRTGNSSNDDLRRIVLGAWAKTMELLQVGEPLVEIRPRVDSST